MPQPRHSRNPGPPLLAILLMLALAVTFALLIKGNHPHFAGPMEPPMTPAPSPTQTTGPVDGFPAQIREQVPGLTPDITDEQIIAEAIAVCEDISARGASEVYNTRETPTTSPEDAAKFFWASVTEKCPASAEDLVNVMTGAPE